VGRILINYIIFEVQGGWLGTPRKFNMITSLYDATVVQLFGIFCRLNSSKGVKRNKVDVNSNINVRSSIQ